jgi:hypothetical protein
MPVHFMNHKVVNITSLRLIPTSLYALVALAILLAARTCAAQDESWFPESKGDIRQYRYDLDNGLFSTEETIADSILPTGNHLATIRVTGVPGTPTRYYEIDSASNVWWISGNPSGTRTLIYRGDATIGDTWDLPWAQRVRLADTGNVLYCGKQRKTRLFEYEANGLGVIAHDLLAQGFGLIHQDEEAGPGVHLAGSIIGGKECGQVTAVTLQQRNDNSDIHIYPSPTSSLFNIIFNSPYIGYVEIAVMDIAGNKVFSQAMDILDNDSHLTINLNSLVSGMYIITVRGMRRETSTRIFILH